MPSFKTLQLPHQIKKDGTAQILIRITHGRKVKYIKTGYYVKPAQLREGIVIKHSDAALMNIAIEEKKSKLLQNILRQDLSGEEINIGKAAGKKPESSETMFGAIKHVMNKYQAQNQPASFNRMKTNFDYLQKAWQKDIYISDITKIDVEKYVNYRYQLGNGASTVKKNLKDLSSVLNHIDYKGRNFFQEYSKSIKAEPVQREKLTADEIKLLESVKLKGLADVARDMFLFSFYTQGSRFESVATLSREAINNNHIIYRMNKGKKIREILIHPKLKNIIEKYFDAKTLYLFPVVKEKHNDWNKKEIIGRANALINNFLNHAAQQAGIERHIHFHLARHAASYLALVSGINTSIIKDALGHSSIRTTEVYLKSLSDDKINEAYKILYE